jgi:hypothetical protein
MEIFMELVEYTSKEQLVKIEALYMEAFPEEERKPFDLMTSKIGSGVEMLAIEEAGEFLGLAIMLIYDNIALLDYFAIMPHKRGSGIGSRALGALKEHYCGKTLLIEIEDTEEDCENHADRVRRKAFYLRNDMVEMDYKVWFFGTKMQVLTGGDVVTFESHNRVYEAVFCKEIADKVALV